MRAYAVMVVAALLVAPSPGEAASKNARFRSLVKQGKSQAHASDFAKALESFEAAFALVASPEVLFEIARCHEKAAEPAQAIEAYERLLLLPHPGARLRAKAKKALEALRGDEEAKERVRVAEAKPADVALETKTSTLALVSAQADLPKAVLPARVEATAAEPEGSHVLQISAVSLGGAAIVASAVFGVLAFRASHRFDRSSVYSERAALQAEAGRDAHIADAFAIGGVMTAGFGLAFW
jgi:hypothetical protein